MEEINQLKRQVEELTQRLNALSSTATIPWEVDAAFRDRLGGSLITTSTKGVNSEDVTINEAGSGTFVVMNDPDAFLQVIVEGTIYHIPVFTS